MLRVSTVKDQQEHREKESSDADYALEEGKPLEITGSNVEEIIVSEYSKRMPAYNVLIDCDDDRAKKGSKAKEYKL